jgi:hypothetical protein
VLGIIPKFEIGDDLVVVRFSARDESEPSGAVPLQASRRLG